MHLEEEEEEKTEAVGMSRLRATKNRSAMIKCRLQRQRPRQMRLHALLKN